MGEVYEAEDQELGERIALKVIRRQASLGTSTVERLRREVQLARRVTHPNVCRVFDLGYHRQQQHEIIFLTMELIKGETPSARLKRIGRLNPAEALPIAAQLCQALDAAHQAGVLHRDFKCSNVMLHGRGRTGAGRGYRLRHCPLDAAQGVFRQPSHHPGHDLRHPAYMSPEQILGENLTASSDIYSLGLVLYEMVTGNRPFHQDSQLDRSPEAFVGDCSAPHQNGSRIGHDWNRTIPRCLERDPARKFHFRAASPAITCGAKAGCASWAADHTGKVAMVIVV